MERLFPGSQILRPVGYLYEKLMSVRNTLYDRKIFHIITAPLPVISVGNVTVGGSGKTPFCLYLAKQLEAEELSPVVLLRGYGGRYKGPHCVTENDLPIEVGDEAALYQQVLGEKISVVVSRDRACGVQYIYEKQLGKTVILDDGLQHRRLSRDVEIVIVDRSTHSESLETLHNEVCLPSGTLRENVHEAFQRATMVIFLKRVSDKHSIKGESKKGEKEQLFKEKPLFNFFLYPFSFIDAYSGETHSLESFMGKRGTAVTAIGKPDQFFQSLRSLGIELVSKQRWRDHYHFTKNDWNAFKGNEELAIFTTEKDGVKLRSFVQRSGELFMLKLHGEFLSPEEQQRFMSVLFNQLERSAHAVKRVSDESARGVSA